MPYNYMITFLGKFGALHTCSYRGLVSHKGHSNKPWSFCSLIHRGNTHNMLWILSHPTDIKDGLNKWHLVLNEGNSQHYVIVHYIKSYFYVLCNIKTFFFASFQRVVLFHALFWVHIFNQSKIFTSPPLTFNCSVIYWWKNGGLHQLYLNTEQE